MVRVFPSGSISNRRSRSSRNGSAPYPLVAAEHIESEIALKPERNSLGGLQFFGAYRIGDRAQAGTCVWPCGLRELSISNRRSRSSRNQCEHTVCLVWSISNRRSRSSRNGFYAVGVELAEHIESEIALKPEHLLGRVIAPLRAYRIGDRAQAGTLLVLCCFGE